MKQADNPKEKSDKEKEVEKAPQKPEEGKGIVQPMIDELMRHPKDAPQPAPNAPPRGPVHPPEPSELDQDAGSGYNPDHTYPQT